MVPLLADEGRGVDSDNGIVDGIGPGIVDGIGSGSLGWPPRSLFPPICPEIEFTARPELPLVLVAGVAATVVGRGVVSSVRHRAGL